MKIFYALLFILFFIPTVRAQETLTILVLDKETELPIPNAKVSVCYTYCVGCKIDCDVGFTDITGEVNFVKRRNKRSPYVRIIYNHQNYEDFSSPFLWDEKNVKDNDGRIERYLHLKKDSYEKRVVDEVITNYETELNEVEANLATLPSDSEDPQVEELRENLIQVSEELSTALDSLIALRQGLNDSEVKIFSLETQLRKYSEELISKEERIRNLEYRLRDQGEIEKALNLTINSNLYCVGWSRRHDYLIVKFQIIDKNTGSIISAESKNKPKIGIILKREGRGNENARRINDIKVYELINPNVNITPDLNYLPLRRLNKYSINDETFYDFSIGSSGFITAVIVFPESVKLQSARGFTYQDYMINFLSGRLWLESNSSKSMIIEPFELSDIRENCIFELNVEIDENQILDPVPVPSRP